MRKQAREYEAAIVLGCDTATETVRDAVEESSCRVIEGMEVSGLMNAKLKLQWSGTVTFEDCRIIPISQRNRSNEEVRPRAGEG